MWERIQERLEALQTELEKGHTELQKVDAQRRLLHDTVLRIDGAIQVLKELADSYPAEQVGDAPGETQPASEPTTRTRAEP